VTVGISEDFGIQRHSDFFKMDWELSPWVSQDTRTLSETLGWQVLWKDQGNTNHCNLSCQRPRLKSCLSAGWVPAAGRAGCPGVEGGRRGQWWEPCLGQLV